MPQNNKVAIVTGASAGIGQASAKALHQAGFRVFGTSRRAVANVNESLGEEGRRKSARHDGQD